MWRLPFAKTLSGRNSGERRLCPVDEVDRVQATQVQPGTRRPRPAAISAVEEHVTVSATRTDIGIEDLPMRVEVPGKEELDEKVMMTPGDIVMMLNEMGGLRAQATSASLGAASVRIQGCAGGTPGSSPMESVCW
jgi:hypothetical protein